MCCYVVLRELVMCVLLCGATYAGYVCVVMWCYVSWLCMCCYVVRRELVMCLLCGAT